MGRPITHTIDPDGEVIIILLNANAPFAEFYDDQDAVTEMLAQEATVEEKDHVQSQVETADDAAEHVWEGFGNSLSVKQLRKSKKKKEKKKSKRFSSVETAVRPVDVPEPDPAEPEPVDEPVEELESWTVDEPAPEPPEPVEEPEPEPEPVDEPEPEPEPEPVDEPVDESTQKTDQYQSDDNVYIQVSAKHLMLASPVFKSMLTGSWKESVIFSKLQKGSIEITAESWDIDGFLILLRIIHCQFNHIPRKLSLEMLAKVAVIADYYKCKEVVRFFSDTWIEALEERYLEEYSRDLILRLWIAWFFQLSSQFKKVTSIAISHNGGFISSLGLPIPNRVIDKMNLRRQEAIENIIYQLYEKQEAFLHDSRGCRFECSSIMYGALSKHMQSTGLLSPKPMIPFLRMNYNQLVQSVLSFKSPQWYHSSYNHHSCKDSNFRYLFPGLDEKFDGFDLLELILE